jgi:hypothetical protein
MFIGTFKLYLVLVGALLFPRNANNAAIEQQG